MKQLTYGNRGPQVQFLQLALNRAGCGPVATDGIYGSITGRAVQEAQKKFGLPQDGTAGIRTHRALHPYYTGYTTHIVTRGDTLYSVSRKYHTSLRSVEIANPYVNPTNLRIGSLLTVPFSFPVVPNGINWSSDVVDCVTEGLSARYPFFRRRISGRSAMGKPIYSMSMGKGYRNVLYNATHHGNEWITTPILLQFGEELASAYAREKTIYNVPAETLLNIGHLVLVPCVNPDGMDIATGFLRNGPTYRRVEEIAKRYPAISFPEGWKANIHGVDLNLQYPASWDKAKKQKFALGYTSPAPRDYVGTAPLTEPEARTMTRITELTNPDRILAYHTQGEVIYPNYLDFDPPGSKKLAWQLAAASGYTVEDTPNASAYAGYKDWFIQSYNRPGYTIEAGKGVSPLPISDFDSIYEDNLPILVNTIYLD